MLTRRRIALATLLALLTAGCATTFLKRAPGTPEPKPGKALLAAMLVYFEGEQSLVDMAQNAGLDEFGKKATERIGKVLADKGYEIFMDGARTKKLDAVQVDASAATAALTGQWRHPDASYWIPERVDSLFVKPADIVGKIKGEDGSEYFAFTGVRIRNTGVPWLCGTIWVYPGVEVHTAIYDASAKKVLELKGYGYGDGSFLFANRSPENLDLALERAFTSIAEVPEEAL